MSMPTTTIRPTRSSGISVYRKRQLLSLSCVRFSSQVAHRSVVLSFGSPMPLSPTPSCPSNLRRTILCNAPDIQPATAVALPEISVVRTLPPRPHVAPPANPQPARAGKAPDPVITPELTTEELSIAKGDTQRSFDTVDRNLALSQGKHLNSAQSDLFSQIRGFEQVRARRRPRRRLGSRPQPRQESGSPLAGIGRQLL